MTKKKCSIKSKTNHSEQRSMLEVWMELHQPWFCTSLPLNKSAEKENKCYIIPLKFTQLNFCKMSSTNHDKSSKMGLLLVLNTAMIAGRSAASGSPGGVEKMTD